MQQVRIGSHSDLRRGLIEVRSSPNSRHAATATTCRFCADVLQKSKVAAVEIFGENLKRKEVDDSHSLSRATEVAHEFGARR